MTYVVCDSSTTRRRGALLPFYAFCALSFCASCLCAAAVGQQASPAHESLILPQAPSATLAGTAVPGPAVPENAVPENAVLESSGPASGLNLVALLPTLGGASPWSEASASVPTDESPCSDEPQQGAGEPRPTPPAGNRTGQQPKRILGLMPNYRAVSSGTVPPPPTIKQNFKIATRQAFDYSAFVFLGITSAAAYAQGSHPSLSTYNGGDAVFWAYLWRGFIDKTDGNYLAAFILPTLLREDTRYYAMGEGSKWKRLGYAASRVAVARTYGGRTTPNIAGIGGKVAAQAISPNYYPPGSSDFGVLATKFAYAVARDMGFTVFREFYPDIAIHVLHRNP